VTTRTTHPVLLWFFPVYMLSLTVVYFLGAMAAFTLLYWGTRAVDTWHQHCSPLDRPKYSWLCDPNHYRGQWLRFPEGALGLASWSFSFTFIPGYQAVIRRGRIRRHGCISRWRSAKRSENYSNGPTNGPCRQYEDVWKLGKIGSVCSATRTRYYDASMSPSVQSGQSWVVAAAAVLDAGALATSSFENQDVEAARICVRTVHVRSWRSPTRSGEPARLVSREQHVHRGKVRSVWLILVSRMALKPASIKEAHARVLFLRASMKQPCSSLRVTHSPRWTHCS